jgi:hypothetical protein
MSSWKRRSLLRPDGLKDSDSEENSDDRRNKLNKINVPLSLYALITTATASGVEMEEEESNVSHLELSRTELDSHANMPVVGRHA